MAHLSKRMGLEDISSFAGMGLASLLFFVSGLVFVAMLAAALISTVGIFFTPWSNGLVALLAWSGLCLAAYNVVRCMELVNEPSWRALWWVAIRLALIISPWYIVWLLNL